MGWRALPGFHLRLGVAAAACLLFATRAAAEDERGQLPFPPAALPDAAGRAEPSQGSNPLRPVADAAFGAPKATPDLMEEPARATMHAWFDLPHAFVERRIFDIANGFDQFFADERDLDFLRSSAFMSWRSQMRLAEDGTPAFGTTLRANFTLPYFQRRLRAFSLVLENAGRGLADPEPSAISGRQETTTGNALLRWTLINSLRSSIDINVGLFLKIPPGLVTRARYRFAHELGQVALFRVATSGFWNTFDGLGFNAAMSLERSLVRPGLLLRWTLGTLVSQASHGYETGSEVALLANFSRTTAVTLLASGSTQSKPEPVMGTYRVASRLRAALFRRWLYGELEPEMTWPLDTAGHRHPVTAVMFRFEVQFEDEPPARNP